MKTTSYHIYSNLGFIGFAFIGNNGKSNQGYLTLFETIEFNGGVHLYPSITIQNTNALTMQNIDIIKASMRQAIPTLNTNRLTFYAIDLQGNKISI